MNTQEKAQALSRLMDAYGDALLRTCFMHLGDRQLAEDAVQEAFLKAFVHLEDFRGESSEKTWLTRIAINTCRSMRRNAWFNLRRSELSDALPAPTGADPADAVDDTLVRAVSRLKPKYREVIVLYYYQEMKTREVAQVLGIPERTVSSRLVRAREALRMTVKGGDFDEPQRAGTN